MALARSRERSSPIERGILAVSTAIRDSRDRLVDYLKRPEDPLVDSGLAKLTRTPATARTQYATASALRLLGEPTEVFSTATRTSGLSGKGVSIREEHGGRRT